MIRPRPPWLPLAAVLLALLAVARPGTVSAAAVALGGDRQQILINLVGGLPGRWDSCRAICAPGEAPETLLGPGAGHARLGWEVPGNAEATRRLEVLEYRPEARTAADGGAVLFLTSTQPVDGIHLVHRYRLDAAGRTLSASIQVPAGARLRLTGGPALAGEPLVGPGGIYSYLRAIRVDAAGQAELASGNAGAGPALPAGAWAGLRGRFWTVLVAADQPLRVAAVTTRLAVPDITFARDGTGGGSVGLRFHGGPVTPAELAPTAPELAGMLYASLWASLRALAGGLRVILDFWQGLVGNWGVAILLLSLSVKVLMWPLTWVAERWQAEVNRQQSVLAPEIAAIRRDYRGEEAHNLILAAYRRHGISQFYTLKSLAGFLVQIPVFIAAFDMLGENFALSGAPFLWVTDLSLPDRLAALPVVLPFFGGHLNLLPFLMTAFTLLAARLQEDPSLAPGLRTGQRLRLYALGALFFLLLYTFPAGMVLYWTANNFWHLAKVLAGRALAGRRSPAPAPI